MAYGVLYEFHRTSTNGADMRITISQKGYSGAVKKRALGRAPVIKRDNNGHIYGTSCELYAECLVDGEFSHLYTSDAYEYKVEVYKNNTLLWAGFVSPELYSEPDIAPPYDVQIIATDGLGELKNYNFNKRGVASILDHIKALMSNTGIDLGFNVVSGLRYIDENGAASAIKDILNVKLDLDHEEGNTCYDVLQGILSSLNANITQHNGSYLMFRETDFISKAGANGVEAFTAAGNNINLGVASFGTMKANQWWPVGQLSTVIEPAKNQIVLKSPNHYKGNVLRFDNWTTSEMASFSEAENAYILPGADSYITQTVDFGGHEVGYRLSLRVRARNVGASGDEEQNIGIKVEIDGRSYSAGKKFWLVKSASSSGRPINDYLFRSTEGSIEEDLPTPTDGATASDAQDIDIVLPLYRSGSRSYIYATNVKLTIFNPKGLYDIHVYDVSLVKYEQIKGYEANVTIDNMARESESNVDLTITDGDLAPTAGNVFMTGLPLRPSDSEVITKWQIGNDSAQDYLAIMAFDYSREISLPRMKYSGILNVPGSATVLPTLFLRDGTYYFPKTYSYDLYSDEITVDLISISAADVSLSSVTISQTSEAAGTMGATTGGTSGGGGGAVSIPRDKQMSDTSDNAVENKVIKAYVDQAKKDVEDLLASMWQLIGDRVVTDKKTVVKNDLIVEGDVATGGSGGGQGPGAAGTVTGIAVNGQTYMPTAGIVTIPDYPTSLTWSAIEGKPTTIDGYGITDSIKFINAQTYVGARFADSELNRLAASSFIECWSSAGYWNWLAGKFIVAGGTSSQFMKADGSLDSTAYLPLSGGTISGAVTTPLVIQTKTAYSSIRLHSTVGYRTFGMRGDGNLFVTEVNGWNNEYIIVNSGNIKDFKAGDSDKLGGYDATVYPIFENAATCIGFNLRTTYQSLGQGDGHIEFYDGGWYNSMWGKVIAVNGFVGNLSGNATSATKLQTARTIWGQSFDGTAKVSGAMSEVEFITFSGGWIELGIVRDNGVVSQLKLQANGAKPLLLNPSTGNVGIGTTDPQHKLDVTGTARITGKTTISNDLVVSGDVSTGGGGQGPGAAGTVTGIAVNGQTYMPTAGIVTIPDYPTSLTWSAIEGKPTTIDGYGITDSIKFINAQTYVGARFADSELNRLAASSFIECWSSAGYWNWLAGKFIVAGGTSSQFMKADGSLDSTAYLPLSGGTISGAVTTPLVIQTKTAYSSIRLHSTVGYRTFGMRGDGNLFVTEVNGWNNEYIIVNSGNIKDFKAGDSDKLGGYDATVYPIFENAATCIGFNLRTTYQSLGQGDGHIEFYDGGWYNSMWGKVIAVNGFVGNLSGNATSATKLQTARTIWGQSFDGTAKVSGAMSEVEFITFSGGWIELGIVRDNGVVSQLKLQANGAKPLLLNPSTGNVGIGTTDPQHKLDVTGTARITGKTTISNDLVVSGDSKMNGNLVVTGDVASA